MRFRVSATLRDWAERYGERLGIVLCVWLWIAFGAIFFTTRYPALAPFVTWTFRIYLGSFIGGVIGSITIAPGIYVAKELFELINEPDCSRLELQLTRIWAGVAGALFTALLCTVAWLIIFGPLADVKMWFIGLRREIQATQYNDRVLTS
jgi:hypothetical protein